MSNCRPPKVSGAARPESDVIGIVSPRYSTKFVRKKTCFNLNGNCDVALERYSPGRNKKKTPNHINLFIAFCALVAVCAEASLLLVCSSCSGSGRRLFAPPSLRFQQETTRVTLMSSLVPDQSILGSIIPNKENAWPTWRMASSAVRARTDFLPGAILPSRYRFPKSKMTSKGSSTVDKSGLTLMV